jgi:NADH-quinone oxidoreductase subunit M
MASIGTVLAASYLLWLYQRTAFGEPTEEFSGHGPAAHAVGAAVHDDSADHGDDHELHDVTLVEWIAWIPMLIAILVLGVYPHLLFNFIDPAVTQLVGGLGETLGP